ncbi:MAG TPA: sulfatase [Thermoleophilaceae bacterium]|nr:sulfatase [Thermoleophilaceae bacterium]
MPRGAVTGARLNRRGFIGAAGATAAGLSTWGSVACGGGRSGDDAPNVLMIVVDTLRADHVGAYGSYAHTPNIDRLAADGVRFTRAFPSAMVTVPARRSIFTGRRIYPFRDWTPVKGLGSSPGWEPIANLGTTFTSVLQRAGYWTGMVTDNPYLGFTRVYRPFRLTFDRFVSVEGYVGTRRPPSTIPVSQALHWLPNARLRERYLDGIRRYLANNGAGVDDSESSSARVFGEASKLLRDAGRERPFALVVDSFEPHEPWTPPKRYLDMYDPDYRGREPAVLLYRRADYVAPEIVRRMKPVYAACVTRMDRWLGEFLDAFEEQGLAENTIIVLVSDHGILLGDRGWTGKVPWMSHPELNHVPLIVVHPERNAAGRSSSYFAQTHDIAPTVLSLAGLERPSWTDGVDLSPVFLGEAPPERAMTFGGYYNRFFIRTDQWSLIADTRYEERKFFDLVVDPYEIEDVFEEREEVADDLYGEMVEAIGGPPPYYG